MTSNDAGSVSKASVERAGPAISTEPVMPLQVAKDAQKDEDGKTAGANAPVPGVNIPMESTDIAMDNESEGVLSSERMDSATDIPVSALPQKSNLKKTKGRPRKGMRSRQKTESAPGLETASQQNLEYETEPNGVKRVHWAPDLVTKGDAEGLQVPDDQHVLMPPPAAPASMLWSIRPSDTARHEDDQTTDGFVYARLISAVVTLFRMGKGKESKAIAQYTIDLIGEKLWKEQLAHYMSIGPEPDDGNWVPMLLSEAAEDLKRVDPVSSGFLSILMAMLD